MRSVYAFLIWIVLGSFANAGVTIGTYGATDATGWSTFTASTITVGTCAAGTANGTCAVYVCVNGVSGCVSNDGTCAVVNVGDTSKACNTAQKAFAIARNGIDDWILFRKGDTWNTVVSVDGTTCCWEYNGVDATRPMVIGAYDPATPSIVNPATGGARPIFNIPSNLVGMQCQGNFPNGCDYMAVVGIEFYSGAGDATVTGRAVVQTQEAYKNLNFQHFFLVEDCKFTWFGNGFLPQGKVVNNFYFRRNVIQNIWAQGFEGSGAGDPSNVFVIEENTIDNNGHVTVTGTATITPGNPTLVTWANGFFAGDRTAKLTFSPGCTGITAGTTYYQYNNNFTTFNLSSSSGSNVAVNTTGCAVTSQTVTWAVQLPTGFVHNMYIGGTNAPGLLTGLSTIRGNIVSRDAVNSQVRSGGTIQDNAWLSNATSHNWGTPAPGTVSQVINNVYLSSQDWGAGTGNSGAETMGNTYKGDSYVQGSTTVSGNILANAVSGTPRGITLGDGFTTTASNNIIYNWGIAPAIDDGSGHTPTSGGIVTGTVTNGGSGYTDFVMNITALGTDSTQSTTLAKVTVDNVSALADIDGSNVYITGLGGGGCAINNVTGITSFVQRDGVNTVTLSLPIGTCTFSAGAKLYYPVNDGGGTAYGVFGLTNTAPQSGSGSGATIMAISAGGQIVSVWLGGADLSSTGARGIAAGKNFVVNDTTTTTIPGGTGFVYKVTAVSAYTDGGGNQLFPAGPAQSGWPIPTATAAKYYDLVSGSAGHTTIDFINAAAAMDKRTWNPLLTANRGLNLYIRAAFGVGHCFGC